MTQLIKSGDVFSFTPSHDNMLPRLPKGVYKIVSTMDGYVFVRDEPFKRLESLYGDHGRIAKRIYRSFKERKVNTGVLLAGTKGSGKSFLGRLLSQEASDEDMPTIIITEPISGETLRGMLSQLEQKAVILIDEFEKVYDNPKDQLTFLSLLDGLSTTQHLFILTVNDVTKVDQHMKDRPGRLYYLLEFYGLEEDFIREYCIAKLNDKSQVEEVVELTSLFDEFNFDMLSSLVEEMNRFDESALEAVKYLNIASDGNLKGRYILELFKEDGTPIHNHNSVWFGNPLRPETPVIYWVQSKNDDEDERQVELHFTQNHVLQKDPRKGFFSYEVDGITINLKNSHKRNREDF